MAHSTTSPPLTFSVTPGPTLVRDHTDLVIVAALLGHARLETTRRYSYTDKDKADVLSLITTDRGPGTIHAPCTTTLCRIDPPPGDIPQDRLTAGFYRYLGRTRTPPRSRSPTGEPTRPVGSLPALMPPRTARWEKSRGWARSRPRPRGLSEGRLSAGEL